MTLTELQSRLPKEQFLRVHKSYIIAVSGIERVKKHQVSIGDVKIPISKLYRDALLEVIGKDSSMQHLDPR